MFSVLFGSVRMLWFRFLFGKEGGDQTDDANACPKQKHRAPSLPARNGGKEEIGKRGGEIACAIQHAVGAGGAPRLAEPGNVDPPTASGASNLSNNAQSILYFDDPVKTNYRK